MNYSKMTDFEINKRVLEIKSGMRPIGYAHHADKRSAAIVDVNNNYHWYDFCHSWADAGPIIEKHMICLAADVFSEPQDGGKWVARPAYGWDKEAVRSDNPLRAAMILFLQSREKPNE